MSEEKKLDKRAAIEQRPRPGATRCPFCHEPCEADADACACAECLSRHHRSCWTEGAACASCGATARLELAAAPSSQTQPATSTTSTAPTDVYGFGATIDAWLRLGLVYNAVLVAISLLLLGPLLVTAAGLRHI